MVAPNLVLALELCASNPNVCVLTQTKSAKMGKDENMWIDEMHFYMNKYSHEV